MYNNLLTNVVKVIENRVNRQQINNLREEQYTYLFNPEDAQRLAEKNWKREQKAQTAIEIVTGIAILGEAYHLAKRSGVLKRLTKK